MKYQKELIEHLSEEIKTTMNYISIFRSKIAFTILLGPFVILGTFLIATKGNLPSIANDTIFIVTSVIACVCYLGLGFYGAKLDGHACKQCNRWRKQIVKISNDEEIKFEDIKIEHQLNRVYLIGLSLVLLALLSVILIINSIEIKTNPEQSSGANFKNGTTIASPPLK